MKEPQNRKRYAQFHLWIDPDILNQLRALARKEGRTTAEIVREAVAKILRERQSKSHKDSRNL
jgi:predicted DNA-binding protein